jgi:hypothetical protein
VTGLAWPSYLRSREARLKFANQGSFSSRVVISLNCLAFLDEEDVADDGIPALFYMRTLAEQGLDGFFPDEFSRHVLDVAKLRLMKRGREIFDENEAKKNTGVGGEKQMPGLIAPSRPLRRTEVNPSGGDETLKVDVGDSEANSIEQQQSHTESHPRHHASSHSLFSTLPSLAHFADRLVADQTDMDAPQDIPSLRGSESLKDIFYFNPVMQVAKVHKTAYLGLLDHVSFKSIHSFTHFSSVCLTESMVQRLTNPFSL